MSQYTVNEQNRVRQIKRKASYDTDVVHAILDAGRLAHVAFVQDDVPIIVPMLYARDGESILLHGARKARIVKILEKNPTACINVTLLDGVVIARSMFNCSMNYRSVTVFGRPQLLDEHEEKRAAVRVISERLLPGRWEEARASHDKEIKMTGVLRVAIDSASAKVSQGMPNDEPEDYDLPIWAGVLPLTLQAGELRTDPAGCADQAPSQAVRTLENKPY
ncbi:MAG: pyridoxamine 5'-phosphate oxidase family protein [Gammaproteobacteria bacterium]